MKEVLFLLPDSYAEWEAAPLAAAVNQHSGFCVKTVSPHPGPVSSIGGFSTNPDYTLGQAMDRDFSGLVLIGSKCWRHPETRPAGDLIRRALERRTVVAAICDATVFLGTLGTLSRIPHTSNQLEDLQSHTESTYTGASLYRREQAVCGGNIITANGTAAPEFARETLTALGAMGKIEAEQWYRFYRLGYYEAMRQSGSNV